MDFDDEIGKRRAMMNRYMDGIFEPIMQSTLRNAMKYLPGSGGKRLRPIFALLSCELAGGKVENAMDFGAALELIHNFTLVHDDIMDDDDTRRGHPTVHKVYSLPTAINAGDGLYSHALDILTRSNCSHAVFRRLVREMAITVRAIGEGQQDDMDFERMNDVTVRDYFRMIENKTARIFELACKGGGLLAGASEETVEILGEFGRDYGISFQLTDDYLDVAASSEEIGKPSWSDIREGKKTLIIVHAMENAREREKEDLARVLGNHNPTVDEITRAKDALHSTGSIQYAREAALDYIERAKRSLYLFDDVPSRELLLVLSDNNITRRF